MGEKKLEKNYKNYRDFEGLKEALLLYNEAIKVTGGYDIYNGVSIKLPRTRKFCECGYISDGKKDVLTKCNNCNKYLFYNLDKSFEKYYVRKEKDKILICIGSIKYDKSNKDKLNIFYEEKIVETISKEDSYDNFIKKVDSNRIIFKLSKAGRSNSIFLSEELFSSIENMKEYNEMKNYLGEELFNKTIRNLLESKEELINLGLKILYLEMQGFRKEEWCNRNLLAYILSYKPNINLLEVSEKDFLEKIKIPKEFLNEVIQYILLGYKDYYEISGIDLIELNEAYMSINDSRVMEIFNFIIKNNIILKYDPRINIEYTSNYVGIKDFLNMLNEREKENKKEGIKTSIIDSWLFFLTKNKHNDFKNIIEYYYNIKDVLINDLGIDMSVSDCSKMFNYRIKNITILQKELLKIYPKDKVSIFITVIDKDPIFAYSLLKNKNNIKEDEVLIARKLLREGK